MDSEVYITARDFTIGAQLARRLNALGYLEEEEIEEIITQYVNAIIEVDKELEENEGGEQQQRTEA